MKKYQRLVVFLVRWLFHYRLSLFIDGIVIGWALRTKPSISVAIALGSVIGVLEFALERLAARLQRRTTHVGS